MADKKECPECGMPPGECYRICPTQDPYHGDQAAEAADHDFNARYDDVRERYAATAADAELEFEYEDERIEDIHVVDESFFQPVPDNDNNIPF